MRVWAAVASLLVLASAPEPLTLPGFRLHLDISDDIVPDRLEALCRPGVVLWLKTSSNRLKRSLAERVERAEAAYLQVHPPMEDGLREQFGPRVHPSVSLEGLDVGAYRRWAPLGTAVEFEGTLTEERARNVLAIRPQAVHWHPDGPPSHEEWERAKALPGLEVRPGTPLPACLRPLTGAHHIRLSVPAAQADSSAAGCGFALRLEVPVAISSAELRTLLVQYPGAELRAQVANDGDAAAAAALVGLLTEAVPTARAAPAQEAH